LPAQLNTVFQQLRRVVLIQDGAGLSDGQLLEMFVSHQDQAAFEALVRRHAQMVMKVSRREFLVMARSGVDVIAITVTHQLLQKDSTCQNSLQALVKSYSRTGLSSVSSFALSSVFCFFSWQ
jgi:hypothetical protein